MRYIGYTSDAKNGRKFSEVFIERLRFVTDASLEEIIELASKIS